MSDGDHERVVRHRLPTGWRWSALFWAPVALVVFGVFGPGFIALGFGAAPSLVVGIPMTGLFIFAVLSLLRAPLEISRPSEIVVDEEARVLRVRAVPTVRASTEIRFHEVARIVLRRSQYIGLLPRAVEEFLPESLHLDLELRDGATIVALQNRVRAADERIREIAADLSRRVAVPIEGLENSSEVDERERAGTADAGTPSSERRMGFEPVDLIEDNPATALVQVLFSRGISGVPERAGDAEAAGRPA